MNRTNSTPNQLGLDETQYVAFDAALAEWQRLDPEVRKKTRKPQPKDYATQTPPAAISTSHARTQRGNGASPVGNGHDPYSPLEDCDPDSNVFDFLAEARRRALNGGQANPADRLTEAKPTGGRPAEQYEAVVTTPDAKPADIEQYLDRSVDLKTLRIPLTIFPSLYGVLPQSETIHIGWPAFVDAVAPSPAPTFKNKSGVPYFIAGALKEARLTKAAQKQYREAGNPAKIIGKDAKGNDIAMGEARSDACLETLGPAVPMDYDSGDVLALEDKLRALGCACCIYTSYSYGTIKEGKTEIAKGGRLLLCLNRTYLKDEQEPLWYGANDLLGGGFDPAGKSAALCYGMYARSSSDVSSRRIDIEGAALNVDVLVARGRQLMPAKKTATTKHEGQSSGGAPIEEIADGVKFFSGYLNEHPEVFADELNPANIAHEPTWMDTARSFAHQAWRCEDQEEELERLLDELSQRAPGYDKEKNAERFARYVEEAPERAATGDLGGARTINSFFSLIRSLGWKGYVPPAFVSADKYEPITRDAPELAKLDAAWIARILEGGADDAFVVACELARKGFDDQLIARVVMTTPCGAHVQELPTYRLPQIIRRARDFLIDPDLEAMNSRHAVLPIGDKTRVVTWGDDLDFPGRKTIVRAQSFDDFKNLHSNKRKVTIAKDDEGKAVRKETPIGAWWLGRKQRRQYDGGRRFMPEYEREVVNETLNMFEGFAVRPRKPEGKSGAAGCKLFLDHGLKIICSGDEEHYDYLIKREAWIIQNRRRSEIACGYQTEDEGSGKGTWVRSIGYLYGRHYMQLNKAEHIIGKFNNHLEMLLKLNADEALFVGDPRHRNILFGLITEPTIEVEPKNIGLYTVPNYLNLDITTNSPHFFPASRTARRVFIPIVSMGRVGDFEYFRVIKAQLENEGGYEALLYHLRYEVDLRDFDVRKVPKTAALAEQVMLSRKGIDGLVEKVCNEGMAPCTYNHDWPDFSIAADSSFLGRPEKGFDTFIDNHPDRDVRNLGALRVKNILRKEWGCTTGKAARKYDSSKLAHGIQWPSLLELRAKFEQRHGRQEWLHPELKDWDQRAVKMEPAPAKPEPTMEEIAKEIEAAG